MRMVERRLFRLSGITTSLMRMVKTMMRQRIVVDDRMRALMSVSSSELRKLMDGTSSLHQENSFWSICPASSEAPVKRDKRLFCPVISVSLPARLGGTGS